MNTRRPGRDDFETTDDGMPDDIVLAAGTLRAGEARFTDPRSRREPQTEERLSVFWRVFGATILSIVALVAITLYNHQATSINELRMELSRVNEARTELVKKEEFNSRTQNIWDRVQSLQELRATVTGLKEQVSGFGEKHAELKTIRDSLATVDQRLKTAEEDHRALARAELTITALEQKAAARDTLLKAAEEDRKDMVKQLQELRERLAKVEGVTETKPMSKSSSAKTKDE